MMEISLKKEDVALPLVATDNSIGPVDVRRRKGKKENPLNNYGVWHHRFCRCFLKFLTS